jgi:Reverse transcriptase (RNA-dependent DNA polymerase)
VGLLKDAYDLANLDRAWRWIRSNPDSEYKSYFRKAYSQFALVDFALLPDLQKRLKRGTYQPSHACKIFYPKRSGILRPYTLLTVEDQIVYQALVNIVAERLFPRVQARYLTETFGHLYAGKSSVWFYRKWSDGYKAFNRTARQAFNSGLKFTASFDLTAYYDSLDHGVLRHFLASIGCDQEFCSALTEYLSRWTATQRRVYHNHGIPQGPLGSGLLSEVVLQHFDSNCGDPKRVRYLRYVDDIRLFAKTPRELREMIVKLDLLSKDVGLFPQSSKIEIHEVEDIEAELKSVSRPPEDAIKRETVDQEKLRKRIVTLSPRFRVTNDTRFKFLLAHASPSSALNSRLWKILENRPDLYDSIFRYFRRYKTLPRLVAKEVVTQIKRSPLYDAVTCGLISTAEGRLPKSLQASANKVIKALWKPKGLPPSLAAHVGSWLLREGLLTSKQADRIFHQDCGWWVTCRMLEALNDRHYSAGQVAAILNHCLTRESNDVAISAATEVVRRRVPVTAPTPDLNRSGAIVLNAFGVIATIPRGRCGISASMKGLLGKAAPDVNWRTVFGREYAKAERQALWCRAYSLTDMTAFVNALDVFNEWLLSRLYQHDTSLGTYTLGKIGSVLSSTRLKAGYPVILSLASSVHNQRLKSMLSHPTVRNTGRVTGQVRFSYLPIAKRLMLKAFKELKAKW